LGDAGTPPLQSVSVLISDVLSAGALSTDILPGDDGFDTDGASGKLPGEGGLDVLLAKLSIDPFTEERLTKLLSDGLLIDEVEFEGIPEVLLGF
jgi:hypothetical protein